MECLLGDAPAGFGQDGTHRRSGDHGTARRTATVTEDCFRRSHPASQPRLTGPDAGSRPRGGRAHGESRANERQRASRAEQWPDMTQLPGKARSSDGSRCAGRWPGKAPPAGFTRPSGQKEPSARKKAATPKAADGSNANHGQKAGPMRRASRCEAPPGATKGALGKHHRDRLVSPNRTCRKARAQTNIAQQGRQAIMGPAAMPAPFIYPLKTP